MYKISKIEKIEGSKKAKNIVSRASNRTGNTKAIAKSPRKPLVVKKVTTPKLQGVSISVDKALIEKVDTLLQNLGKKAQSKATFIEEAISRYIKKHKKKLGKISKKGKKKSLATKSKTTATTANRIPKTQV